MDLGERPLLFFCVFMRRKAPAPAILALSACSLFLARLGAWQHPHPSVVKPTAPVVAPVGPPVLTNTSESPQTVEGTITRLSLVPNGQREVTVP